MPASSWAKRTGFKAKLSGETNTSYSGQIVAVAPAKPKEAEMQPDLESGRPLNGEPASNRTPPAPPDREPTARTKRESGGGAAGVKSAGQNGQVRSDPPPPPPTGAAHQPKPSRGEELDVLPQSHDDEGFVARHSHMKYELRDTPGLGEILGFFSFSARACLGVT